MRTGIIGSGRTGGNAGTLFARAGHEVMFSSSRDPEKLRLMVDRDTVLFGNATRVAVLGYEA